jgi:uncharacterized membrane protein (DUF4010 family)
VAAALTPLTESDAAMGLAVAALVGLAVGIERQWSGHASGPDARFAGARTFFLLGATGGLAGWLFAGGAVALSAGLLGGATLLVAAAYAMATRRATSDPDGTTEVAALVVLGLGAMAGLGHLQLASAAAVVVVLALHEKSRIHGFVSKLDDWELRGALQFAVLALVVLPLLPQGPYGPLGGIRPQSLWILVLVFSGLNFAGFVARHVVGATRGYGVAGLAGGLVSSTAVTLTFARQSRVEPELGIGLAAGVVGACTVLLVRVGVVTFALNAAAGWALLPYLALPLVTGVLLTAWALRAGRPEEGRPEASVPPTASPLNLGSAVRMAVAFQLSLMALDWVRARFGEPGVLPLAGLLGLTDMDALTISMAKLEPREAMAGLAAQAIAVGLLSNTVLKLVLSVGLGAPGFRARAGAGLAFLGAATLLALVLL